MSFAADTAAIFDGPLGVDATYAPASGGSSEIRVVPQLGDAEPRFGDRSFVSAASMFKIQVADVATPAAGDTLTIGGETYIVQGAPVRDDRRLWWRVEARVT